MSPEIRCKCGSQDAGMIIIDKVWMCPDCIQEHVKGLEQFIKDNQWGYDWGSDQWCISCGSPKNEHAKLCELIKLVGEDDD